MYDDDGVFTMLFSKRVPPATLIIMIFSHLFFANYIIHTDRVLIYCLCTLFSIHGVGNEMFFQFLFIEHENLLYILFRWH